MKLFLGSHHILLEKNNLTKRDWAVALQWLLFGFRVVFMPSLVIFLKVFLLDAMKIQGKENRLLAPLSEKNTTEASFLFLQRKGKLYNIDQQACLFSAHFLKCEETKHSAGNKRLNGPQPGITWILKIFILHRRWQKL